MWSIDRLRPVLSILLPAGLRAVMDVQWQPGVPDTLAVVYAPATVVLWNTKTATKIGTKRTVSELEGRMRPDVHAFCAVGGGPAGSTCGAKSFSTTCCSWRLTRSNRARRSSSPSAVFCTRSPVREPTDAQCERASAHSRNYLDKLLAGISADRSKEAVVRKYQVGDVADTRRGAVRKKRYGPKAGT